MNEIAVVRGAEPRRILQVAIARKIPAIMSYLSKGKWHVAKVYLSDLGACSLSAHLLPTPKPHPINIRPDQPVGVSLKHGYGKFIFETKVVALEPSTDARSRGKIVLEVPDRVEIVQRRNYFRVEVPKSLKVSVLLWHRRQQDGTLEPPAESSPDGGKGQVPPSAYWQGRLVDISAGGAQIAIDTNQEQDFRVGQFIGLRFTPMPYETPILLNAQIRNILPTADGRSSCLGLQIVGLEASSEGRQALQRLCNVVEQYYQLHESGVNHKDVCEATNAT
ncbi:MAG: flagellar brake protein [Planctomycetota bacterium]